MDATASFALHSRRGQSQVLCRLKGCNVPRVFSTDSVTDILKMVRMSLTAFSIEHYIVPV